MMRAKGTATWLAVLVLLLALVACGADDDGSCDVGARRACAPAGGGPGSQVCGDDSTWGTCRPGDLLDGGSATAPTLPAPPSLLPCPAGWEEVTDDDGTFCEPFPGSGVPTRCGVDEAHFPGESGCVRVGTACPAGDFPEGLPADAPVFHVLAGASGGDGTSGAPFGSIRDGRMAASTGAVVAIGGGTYDEVVEVRSGVTFWGACVADTVLTSSMSAQTSGVLLVRGAGSEVRNLRVSDSDRPAAWVGGRGLDLHLESVVIERAETVGLAVVLGGALTAHELVVRDTRMMPPGDLFGRGILIQDGSSAEITRGAFERNHEIGVNANDVGSHVVLEDTVVWDTQSLLPSGTWGRGMSVQLEASAEVRRSAFVGNRVSAIFSGLTATGVELEDTVLRDTHAQALGVSGGRAIGVQEARIVGRRVLVERSSETGIFVADPTGVAELEDLILRDTLPQEGTDLYGRGIDVLGGGSITVTRGLITRSRNVAAIAFGAGGLMTLEDITIADTDSSLSDRAFGRAASVQDGAEMIIRRALLERNRDVSIYAKDVGSRVELEHVTVRDTMHEEFNGSGGRGMNIQEGATVTWTHGLVERSTGVAVFIHGAGTSATLSDLRVRGITNRPCAEDGRCPGQDMAHGIGSYAQAVTTVSDFDVSEADLCGVHVTEAGNLDLTSGRVTGCAIGACVGDDGYDLSRLSEDVFYLDNDSNIQTIDLPVPDTGDAAVVGVPP